MNKVNGFYLLDKDITKNEQYGFLDIDNQNYFFKRVYSVFDGYNEIVAHEIANYLDIPSVEYKLAIISGKKKDQYGLIAKNYKKEGYSYVSGFDLMCKFMTFTSPTWDVNNLQYIWECLEHYFQDIPNKTYQVGKIMYQLIKNVFLFDVFLMNNDRHYFNWELEIDNVTKDANLNVIFDNENIFSKYGDPMLSVDHDVWGDDWYANVTNFLKQSSQLYIDIFLDMYEKLNPDVIKKLINQTELKNEIEINKDYKKNAINGYTIHYARIDGIIEEVLNSKKRS